MSFEQALIEEIAGLERELEGDPRFQKLRDLRNLLRHYRPNVADEMPPSRSAGVQSDVKSADAAVHRRVFLGRRKGGRQRDPERQRALDEAVNFVRESSGMPTTAEVYEHLIQLGITIGGQSPQGNLSAMLYKDGRLTSHGRAGWTFGPPSTDDAEAEKPSEENEPHDAGASHGSDAGSANDIFG